MIGAHDIISGDDDTGLPARVTKLVSAIYYHADYNINGNLENDIAVIGEPTDHCFQSLSPMLDLLEIARASVSEDGGYRNTGILRL